jgi:hypothetical protein
MKKIVLIICFILSPLVSAQEKCLDVEGLQFEAISYASLLVSRAGKNIAIININSSPGDLRKLNPLQFRFFTPRICEYKNFNFHINGNLVMISSIQILVN